jgi:peptidoglycan/xylan/chitin deacetylase (PgdA/CDA1 family)
LATSNPTATVTAAAPAPNNTAPPTISGTAQQGLTLTASNGGWSGSPTSFAYQWSRCNVNGKGCTNIPSANSQTYLLTAGDVGFTIRVVVTATNNGGSTSATSNQTSLVTAAPVSPPANTSPPTISGVAQEGQTLTAGNGSWSGSTAAYTYKWQSCNSGSCADIAGATNSTYVLTAAEIGSTIDVVVTATNAAGFASATSDPTATVTAGVRPVNNNCSAGYVAFTFDDGPSENTAALLQQLHDLNLKATFFVIGENINTPAMRQLVLDEYSAGHTVGNHTHDHASFTGQSTGTAPLTESQATAELENASAAIVAAGVPKPTLYRPPYGDINNYYDLLARNLGYRVVLSYGTAYDSAAGDGNIVDSNDYSGISAAEIADRVINGYTRTINGVTYHWHGIQADSIIAMHDGNGPEAQNTINALQAIVDAMNQKHLCSSATIRPDATGNIVSPPPPVVPATGNLIQNPDLEQVPGNSGTNAEPICWQHGGFGNNSVTWGLTSDAHSGVIAQRLDESNWASGDQKLVLTQRQSQSSCLAAVTPGKTYEMWAWYKGDWVFQGPGAAAVSIATFYRDSAGAWQYWQGSPWFPPTSSWNLAYFKSAPLPAGATAISWGLALQGNGSLTTDDYTMVIDN